MDSESTAILSEAYQRLHRNGPEFSGGERGDNGLTNHGPMAVEVICRRRLDIDVHRWLDRYIRRLTELPAMPGPAPELGRNDPPETGKGPSPMVTGSSDAIAHPGRAR